MNRDDEIIENEQLLSQFLERERKKNTLLLKHYYPELDYEDAESIYQDACIALFNNIKSGRLTAFSCLPSTYFTRICLFQANKYARGDKRMGTLIPNNHNGEDFDSQRIDELIEGDKDARSKSEIMRWMVKILPAPCEEILWDFYELRMSMAEIAQAINYSNANSVKTKKSQCISKLRQAIGQAIKVSANELDKRKFSNLSELIAFFSDVKIEEDGNE